MPNIPAILKRPIHIGLLLCASCAYQEPTHGETATVVVRSASTYNDVLVSYCLDPECEDSKRIGMLAGSRFMQAFQNLPSIQDTYADRQSQTFNIPANETSTLRFTTEKTVVSFSGEPRLKRTFTDYYGLNITLVRTELSYDKDEEEVRCDAIVQLKPTTGSTIELLHDHNDETEACSVSEGAPPSAPTEPERPAQSANEPTTPFYEVPVEEMCNAERGLFRLSAYDVTRPKYIIQVTRSNNEERADVSITKFTSRGEPLATGTGRLGAETWNEAVRIATELEFWNLPQNAELIDRFTEVWRVEACVGDKYNAVRSAPKKDPTLRPLINFIANTEY